MKRVRKLLRQLFCRHEVGLVAEWDPKEICAYVLCHKCGKIYGHFHLPTNPGDGQVRRGNKEKLH